MQIIRGQSRFSRTCFMFVFALLLGALLMPGADATAGGGPNVSGAKLYIQQNNLEEAIRVLQKEIDDVNPNNEDAWYLLGYIYAREKKYDAMLEAFNKAVELKPKFQEKGVKIGKDSGSRFHSKHGVDAILQVVWSDAFNSGVKRFNDAVNAIDDESRAQNFDKAVASFQAAASILPDSTLAYRNWAAALMNAGRTEDSVEPLKRALAANPNDAEVMTMLAQVYMNTRQDSLAVPLLADLWESGRHTEEVADGLSRAYVRMGKVAEAKAIYKEAIESNPDNFNFRYNYGTILLEAKDYDGAIEQLTKAYEIEPESADINYNLGAAYLNRGVGKREALPEDSEDTPQMEDFERAFPYLEKSVKMNPNDEAVWYTLGRIAGQLNKFVLAGYAFAKGEPVKSALDDHVVVGMPSDTLKAVLGEPEKAKLVESEIFTDVEEWVYNERRGTKGNKIAIPNQLKVYVVDGRVDAIEVVE
ncbi:MAG: tetratricopeptide repeat protein [Calditrichaeota bacterium]|nr:tetratricopeptide repeat protein [Calditrichota bacterium]